MEKKIKVSVFCLAYNHEEYIRETLDGFVSQITDFDFEVLIHDDASTDATAKIITEYEEKYPHIIKATYQKENQYSKGVAITRTILLPRAQGEYFAWCEGDDSWTDTHKLQKQVEFLDANKDYSACSHIVLFNNLYTKAIKYVPMIKETRDYTVDEIICGGALFQLSSMVVRRSVYSEMPECFHAKGFGDIQLYIFAAICGKFHVLNDIMSKYNHGTPYSWTERISRNKEKNIEHNKRLLNMYQNTNKYFEYKYDEAFQYAIVRTQCNIYIGEKNWKMARKKPYKKFYKVYKRVQVRKAIKKVFPFLTKLKSAVIRRIL